jgi:hypothetical protein
LAHDIENKKIKGFHSPKPTTGKKLKTFYGKGDKGTGEGGNKTQVDSGVGQGKIEGAKKNGNQNLQKKLFQG